MIDIAAITARFILNNELDRIENTYDSFLMASGDWEPADGEVLPNPVNSSRRAAWNRTKRQTQAIAPRVMNTKRDAVLGTVTWGGTEELIDDTLLEIDLEALAARFLDPLIVMGVTAGVSQELTNANNEPTGEYGIVRIGGYLEPITHPHDVDRIVGLYQAERVQGGVTTRLSGFDTTFSDSTSRNSDRDISARDARSRYNVRVWDWSDSLEGEAVLREWIGLTDPTRLGNEPRIMEGVARPRVRVWAQSITGHAIGELHTSAPTIKKLWALQAREILVSEISSMPMLLLKGGTAEDIRIGPNEVLALAPDETAEWLAPGNQEEIRAGITSTKEQLQQDLALPGGFLGNDSPSGEAFREANKRFRQNTARYAKEVAELLTDLVDDLGMLLGFDGVPVSITPSREFDLRERIDTTVTLYREGVIPLEVAVTSIQEFYEFWSDEDARAWIERQTATVSVADFDRLVGGGNDSTTP